MSKKKFVLPIIECKGDVLYSNDAVNLCYEASKSCYNSGLVYDYETRTKYISARVKQGHESILEHSNIVMVLKVGQASKDDLIEVIASHGFRYLNSSSRSESVAPNNICVLIGGSIRAYKVLIREMYNQNNAVLRCIINLLYKCSVPEFFTDFIIDGIMDASKFQYDSLVHKYTTNEGHRDKYNEYTDYLNRVGSADSRRIRIINADPIDRFYDKLSGYNFNLIDMLNMFTVSIKFEDMSRIITQQLTRHRNAITQESLRYVDGSGCTFVDPQQFKPEKYDTSRLYSINFKGTEYKLNGVELGTDLMTIYNQLRDQGMDKEDARSFLPMGVTSTLYVTFTYSNLLHFLSLRLDKHAQAEIRTYAGIIANSLKGFFELLVKYNTNEDNDISSLIDTYTIPPMKWSEIYFDADASIEKIGEETESIESMNSTAIDVEVEGDEEMKDFGLIGNKPSAPDASAEDIWNAYNPNKYSDTRDDDYKEDK